MEWLWRYLERNVRGSPTVNWVVYVCVLLVAAILVHLFIPASPNVRLALEPRQDSCGHTFEKYAKDGRRMRILAGSEISGMSICSILSSLPNISETYAGVDVYWALGGGWAQAISERRFELIQTRSEQLDALQSTSGDYYQKIAFHPAYSAYFVSRGEQPELTEKFFNGLKLGLRADVRSRSGYILPMRALNERDINLDEDQISRYGSHDELRRGLEMGEVDVIGTHWSESEQASRPEWKAVRIDDVDIGLSWYAGATVHMNPELRCAFVSLLQKASEGSPSEYFSDLRVLAEIERSCSGIE